MAKSISATSKKSSTKGRKTKSLEELQLEIESKCLSIRTIIESGRWSKLRELEPLISRAMADEIGINHTRLITKLRNPITFSVQEVNRLAFYVGTNPDLICQQVNVEIKKNEQLYKKLLIFRKIADMKKYNSK
ncbi:hypothetical protein ACTJJ0_11250 [Chitinophaga sp. 22321]|uniref:hypothetical protein n=1 Tax=Chitinophaga sp. 22321 TaxID=3453909 RepID=UPI003F8511AF